MEKKKVVCAECEDFINVPSYLEGIEYGDALVVAEFPDTHKYTKEQTWCKDIRFKANKRFRDALAEGFPIYVVIYDGMPDVHKRIVRENGYDGDFGGITPIEIYIDQIRFADKMPGKRKDVKGEELVTYSIVNEKHDAKIIDEMISKVDRERFTKMCRVAMHNGGSPSSASIDLYLLEWANAKYDWYVAFGNNLTISTPLDFSMDGNELRPMIDNLCKEYPMFASNIHLIRSAAKNDMEPFVNNKMPSGIDLFKRFAGDIYKDRMKVTRFLSALHKKEIFEVRNNEGKVLKTFSKRELAYDFCAKKRELAIQCDVFAVPSAIAEQFDIDLSKVMQDRIVKGNITISIDPYDFLTSGTTMHGWSTCQRLWGDMSAALFSFITDPGCLIAYRNNGKEYTYDRIVASGPNGHEEVNLGKNAFVGNSKSWRQFIHCDPTTCTFLFSREYPSDKQIADIPDVTRKLLEDTISKVIGVDNWDNYGDLENIAEKTYFGGKAIYKDVNHHHYSDIANWKNLMTRYKIRKTLVSPEKTDMSKAHIYVGGPVYCLKCGKRLSSDSHSCLCGGCR